jgi:hypothetical protein
MLKGTTAAYLLWLPGFLKKTGGVGTPDGTKISEVGIVFTAKVFIPGVGSF